MEQSNAFKAKLANLEKALEEFNAKNVKLSSFPVVALVELNRKEDRLVMPLGVLEKISSQVFESTISVDLRGFGEDADISHWSEVLSEIEKHSEINWQVSSTLNTDLTSIIPRMVKNKFVTGVIADLGESPSEVLKKNLKLLSEETTKTKNGSVFLSLMTNFENIQNLPNFLELAASLKVPDVRIALKTHGYDKKNYETESTLDSKAKSVIEAALKAALKNKVRVTIDSRQISDEIDPALIKQLRSVPSPEYSVNFVHEKFSNSLLEHAKVSVYHRCFKPFSYVHFTPQGWVGPCNHLMDRFIGLGDLNKNAFQRIWNDTEYQNFRKTIVEELSPTNHDRDIRCQWCFKHRLEE